MKILAVGAHPDDFEIGCGATLALFKKRGHEVYALVLSKGEASGDPRIRERECTESARRIEVDKLFFGSLKDTKITDSVETVMEIENVTNLVKPDILFSHSYRDTHQDHRNAGFASISAGRKLSRILLYESPTAYRDFCPQVFVDVESTFNKKIEALKWFSSQNSKIFYEGLTKDDPSKTPHVVSAVEGLARFRGFQAGVRLAEAFEVGKFILEI